MKKKIRTRVSDLFIDIPDSIIVTRSEISEQLESMHSGQTYKEMSLDIGISSSHISNVLRGYANPGKKFLRNLGMSRQWTYFRENGKTKR